MNADIVLTLFKYYAKFVPKPVLEKMFVKTNGQRNGYEEIAGEVLSATDDYVIPELDAFIFSPNEDFLSKRIKNSNKTVLYVEYGAISYSPDQMNGIKEKLAVHVAQPYAKTNNDNLNETLIMSETYRILTSILDRMEKDQQTLDFCGLRQLIEFPAEIVVIDPNMFYDRTGWMAIFDYTTTNIL